MNTNDIKHLAQLSRLHLEDSEVEAYTKQFDEIVAYVDKIKEVTNSDAFNGVNIKDQNTPVNMLREDIVTTYPNPEQIIDEAPRHHDNFVQVKKILKQD